MKFAHLGDCHLGGWRQPELRALNLQSFQFAVTTCIKEKVDFILITGDLFDTAYPSIDTLKDAFEEFRKLKESGIAVFLIAGSHDYSASGKTFLEVLENAGLAKNVMHYEEHANALVLNPILYKQAAIYGYPGKKSSMEVADLARIKLNEAPGFFKILMLHTAIRDAVGTLPIEAVDHTQLPKVDYLALSHLHIHYSKEGRAYSGPIFPNNLSELEELQGGCFYIIDRGKSKRYDIKLKKILALNCEIRNALTATEDVLTAFSSQDVKDAIVIVRIQGSLDRGKSTDIDFKRIETVLKEKGAYVLLKSTTGLHMTSDVLHLKETDTADLEQDLISKFQEQTPARFGPSISQLFRVLQLERAEEEKVAEFEERLLSETKKLLPHEI